MINQLLQGRYLVIKELGKGGFGQTYLAQDTQYPGKPSCVVKKLQVDDPGSLEKAKELFAREAVTLARLGSHDRIPELKAYSEEHFYLVQDFVDGNTLRDEISPQRGWEEKEVIALLEDILKILIFIHDEGVIHRDIKPDNIMRRQRDGNLILIDFGAIKEKLITNLNPNASTIAGSRIYTVGYAPPEQALGKTHFSSDIYALGMTAIEVLTGVHPSLLPEDDTTGEIMWRKPTGQIVGIDANNDLVWLSVKAVSTSFAEILNKMVRYRRFDRYSSAGEALDALHQLRLVTQPQIVVGQIINQLTLSWQEAGGLRTENIRDGQPSKNPGTVRIGRDPAVCDILLSDLTVSGLHVEIFFNQSDARFYLRNLRSSNPAIVNGQALPNGEIALSIGGNIRLGQIDLKVKEITNERSSSAPVPVNNQPSPVTTRIQQSSFNPIATTENVIAVSSKPELKPTMESHSEIIGTVNNQLTISWQEKGRVTTQKIRNGQPSKNPGTIRIGRNPAVCDIVLKDLTVSGLHAEIFFDERDNRFYLRNLQGSYPAIIDGQTLSIGKIPLSINSNISLGQINFKITDIGNEPSSSAPMPVNNRPSLVTNPISTNIINQHLIAPKTANVTPATIKIASPQSTHTRLKSYSNSSDKLFANDYYDYLKISENMNSEDYKYGYKDEKGKIIIPPQFDDTKEFSEGLASVKIGGLWGFIDTKGKWVVEPQFDYAQSYSEGVAPVRKNNLWGFINASGRIVIQFQFGYVDYSEGLFCVKHDYKKWGFIDNKGTFIIPARYELANSFSDGLAGVQFKGLWGFINKSGNIVIPFRFDEAQKFEYGKAEVKSKGSTFYIDTTGKTVS